MYDRQLSYEDMIGPLEFDLAFAQRNSGYRWPPVSLGDVEDISRSCPRLAAQGVNLDKLSDLLARALELGGRSFCADLLVTVVQNTASLTTSRNNTPAPDHQDGGDRVLEFDSPKRIGRVFVMSAGVAGFEDLPGYREPVHLVEQAFRETFSLSAGGQVLCSPFSVSEAGLFAALSATPLLFLRVLQRVLCSGAGTGEVTRSSIWNGLLAPSDDDDSDAVTERFYVMVAVDDCTEGHADPNGILARGHLPPATAAVWGSRMRAFCEASACFGQNEAAWFSAPVSPKSVLLQKLYE